MAAPVSFRLDAGYYHPGELECSVDAAKSMRYGDRLGFLQRVREVEERKMIEQEEERMIRMRDDARWRSRRKRLLAELEWASAARLSRGLPGTCNSS